MQIENWISRTSAVILALFVLAASKPAAAENWPGWRGPRGDGTSLEEHVPLRWGESENIAWKVPLSWLGHASPIVWGDRIFLVGADPEHEDRYVACLDRRDGHTLWSDKVVHAPLERKHRLNSFASSTPATDGELVYVSFLDQDQMLVAAYDFEGNERWKVHPGMFSSVHGYCSSPVIFEDKLIVNGDHDGEAYLVALDRRNGRTIWKTPRENRLRSYCTPIIRDIDGRTQMLLSGSKSVASFDPRSGERHWVIDGPTEQFVASLVFSHDLIFVTGGFPDHHVLSINPTGKGNVTDSHIVWRHQGKLASYVPSPVAAGDYFVVASDDGLVTCLEITTGKVQWSKPLSRHYSASLVTAGGLVYLLDDFGVMHAVRPGKTFEAAEVNRLWEAASGEEPQDSCSASPAISQGQIFIRTERALYCIGK